MSIKRLDPLIKNFKIKNMNIENSFAKIIDGKKVIFKKTEYKIDDHGYSEEFAMGGYTDDVLTHTAIGSYTKAGEEFEELSNIEKL